MPDFEIQTKQLMRIVKIDLKDEAVRVEAGAMYYMLGSVSMEAQLPSVGGFLKSMVTSEKAVKPIYKGTGQLFLEPSYGEFTVLELADGDEWVLDKEAYVASEMSVSVEAIMNKALSGLLSGEGFFQTKVSGKGKVVIASDGPLERIELDNSKLVVDGSFAVARTGKLDFKIEKATKGLFGSVISGEGLVNTFTGTGTVLLCPAQHRDMFFHNQFKVMHSIVSSHSK